MIDLGSGTALIVIPGIQGRWEWMRPAIDALSTRHRVLSFSLSEASDRGDWFSAWNQHIDEALDRSGLQSVSLVGVSFGGLVAAHYAASRPERVGALVLVSAPDPQFILDAERTAYLRHPRLSAASFAWSALRRLLPEIRAALPSRPAQWRWLGRHVARVLRYPASPRRMSAWVAAWHASRGELQREQITAPTLIVTGEADLDRVVPTSSTLKYRDLIAGARHVTLPRTGHVGLVSRPREFARIVGEFVEHR